MWIAIAPADRAWRRLGVAATAVIAAASLAGCATAAKDIGQAAAPAAVKAGVAEASTPDTQQQIQKLIDTKSFQNAGQSVGVGVGIGLFNEANKLAGLSPSGAGPATQPETGSTEADPKTTTAPAPATGPANATAARAGAGASPGAAAVAGLAGGGGGINGLVQSSVQQAFLAATDPKFKEGERALSEAVGEGFLQGVMTVLDKDGPRLGKTVQTQLVPIFQSVIRDQLAPVLNDTLEHQIAPMALRVWKEGAAETLKLTVRSDMQPDVIKNAENASIGASRGTTQGLISAGVLSPDGGLSAGVRFYLWATLVAVAMIGLALFCLLVLLNVLVLRQLWARRGPNGTL